MKKIKVLLSVLALSIISFSFDEQQDKNITITMPASKWNTVIKGLRKLPMEESEEPYAIIMQQAQKQLSDTTKTKR